jgi:hypothetical protein
MPGSFRGRHIFRLFVCIFAAAVGCASAQDHVFADTTHFTLVTEPDGAAVYDGELFIGTTPLRIDKHRARDIDVFYPDKASWKKQRKRLSETVIASSSGIVRLTFSSTWRIETVPFGADVLVSDSVLGTTPLEIQTTGSVPAILLRKKGFESESVALAAGNKETVHIVLRPTAENDHPEQVQDYRGPHTILKNRILVPAAAGFSSAIAAILFKQKANAYYSEYLITMNDEAYDRAHRYDQYAGISLFVTQLAVGYFIYLLFR